MALIDVTSRIFNLTQKTCRHVCSDARLTTNAPACARFSPKRTSKSYVQNVGSFRNTAAERVVYEDNHLLVIYKPAGLLSQGNSTYGDNVLDIYKEYIANKFNKKGGAFLGLIHRLDLPTSGLMVLARTSKAARRLSKYFSDRDVEKHYICIVHGWLQHSGVCSGWIVPGNGLGARSVVLSAYSADSGAIAAELAYTPLCVMEDLQHHGTMPGHSSKDNFYTLVDVVLKTGRKHQIRAQMAHLGYPLLGDGLYGEQAQNINRKRHIKDISLALHNYCLSFPLVKRCDSAAQEKHVFLCDVPPDSSITSISRRIVSGT